MAFVPRPTNKNLHALFLISLLCLTSKEVCWIRSKQKRSAFFRMYTPHYSTMIINTAGTIFIHHGRKYIIRHLSQLMQVGAECSYSDREVFESRRFNWIDCSFQDKVIYHFYKVTWFVKGDSHSLQRLDYGVHIGLVWIG